MIALELDERMIQALKESAPDADVRKADALEVDLGMILQELPEPRGIVSNLPYYITGPLIGRIADARLHFSKAVLMMQKEVAQRIQSRPGGSERGSLSVYLQTLFEIQHVANAPAGAFLPPPKVDSTVLEFVPKSSGMEAELEEKYFRIVRLAFAQRRKTLANNLANGLHRSRDELTELILDQGMDEKIRPQELDLSQWRALAERL
jgi:16S rRNA (adenine1518-N6/adenine1519-N6)-dimethyltransferase